MCVAVLTLPYLTTQLPSPSPPLPLPHPLPVPLPSPSHLLPCKGEMFSNEDVSTQSTQPVYWLQTNYREALQKIRPNCVYTNTPCENFSGLLAVVLLREPTVIKHSLMVKIF